MFQFSFNNKKTTQKYSALILTCKAFTHTQCSQDRPSPYPPTSRTHLRINTSPALLIAHCLNPPWWLTNSVSKQATAALDLEKVCFEMLWLHLSNTKIMKCTQDTGLEHIVIYMQHSKQSTTYWVNLQRVGLLLTGWRNKPPETTLKKYKQKTTNKQTHHEILPPGRNNPGHQYRLQTTSWKSALQERPWGSWRTRQTMRQSLSCSKGQQHPGLSQVQHYL